MMSLMKSRIYKTGPQWWLAVPCNGRYWEFQHPSFEAAMLKLVYIGHAWRLGDYCNPSMAR